MEPGIFTGIQEMLLDALPPLTLPPERLTALPVSRNPPPQHQISLFMSPLLERISLRVSQRKEEEEAQAALLAAQKAPRANYFQSTSTEIPTVEAQSASSPLVTSLASNDEPPLGEPRLPFPLAQELWDLLQDDQRLAKTFHDLYAKHLLGKSQRVDVKPQAPAQFTEPTSKKRKRGEKDEIEIPSEALNVRFSEVFFKDQQRVLEALTKFRDQVESWDLDSPFPQFPPEGKKTIAKLIQKEQKGFQNHLRNLDLKLFKERYFTFEEFVRDDVDQLFKMRIDRVFEFPQHYLLESRLLASSFALDYGVEANSDGLVIVDRYHITPIDDAATTVARGVVPEWTVLPKGTHLPKEKCPRIASSALLSTDPTAIKLATLFQADFVATPSALKALGQLADLLGEDIDVHLLRSAFSLPMISKPGNESKPIVFLEKPFLKKVFSLREKNSLFYKNACRYLAVEKTVKSPMVLRSNPHLFAADSDSELLDLFPDLETDSNSLNNVTYRLFKIGDIKLLLRYRVKGHVNQSHIEPMVKLTYNAAHGTELFTMREVISSYLTLVFRPLTRILLVHVDVVGNRVHNSEIVDPRKIMASAPTFNPARLHHVMYKALKMLVGKLPGGYLVSINLNPNRSAPDMDDDRLLDDPDLKEPKKPTMKEKDAALWAFETWRAIFPGDEVPSGAVLYDLHSSSLDDGEAAMVTDYNNFEWTPDRPKALPFVSAPRAPPLKKDFHYCYMWAHRGRCEDEACEFPHYHRDEVAEVQRRYLNPTSLVNKKAKKAKQKRSMERRQKHSADSDHHHSEGDFASQLAIFDASITAHVATRKGADSSLEEGEVVDEEDKMEIDLGGEESGEAMDGGEE